ncbi:hypothetical protein TrRE_jg6260 [Triparma retinervis]|uniref:HNH nuclease domain-containing protein n=1 Tax=Triparma retinervis TaxID=2557542 RepID=A0A9W7CG52_9STRA|nr:hypothetical protein TrRE_jg6260 [Triparma retinervis]
MNRGLARAADTGHDSMRSQQESNQGESPQQIPYSSYPSLVLNADYQPLSFTPLSLWSWQEAIKAVFSGRVTVVESYDMKISSCSITVPLPSVIALHEYIAQDTIPSFTRRNVFLRDNYRCQYCGVKGSYGELTLDHVIPRCKGGGLNWGNAVTACTRCNCLKGSLPLKEAEKKLGHNLLMKPRRPAKRELDRMASKRGGVRVHESWLQYLGSSWGEEWGGIEMNKDKSAQGDMEARPTKGGRNPAPRLVSQKNTKTLSLDDVSDMIDIFLPNVTDEELRVKLEAVRDGANRVSEGGDGGAAEVSLADLINGSSGGGDEDAGNENENENDGENENENNGKKRKKDKKEKKDKKDKKKKKVESDN